MIFVCLILGAIIVVLNLTDDNQPPEIQIQEGELVYTEGESLDVLLEGVTAIDSQDGDVTDSLLVENVYPIPDGSEATVIYVARDRSNNIVKAARTVNYVAEKSTSTDDSTQTDEENDVTENLPEPTPTPEATPTPEIDLPEGSPRITLTTDAVTIQRGDSINRIEYVANIEDDKDDENELWRSIQIGGDEFDANTPGSYEQIYYVIDSDGNQSNEATLTITVE